MKAIFFAAFAAIIFLQNTAYAQDNVGIGTINPDRSAILELSSNSQGVLLPRMTVGERNNISSPAEGLLIYQTDLDQGFYFFTRGVWFPVGASSAASYANRVLSNLQSPTAVNADLLPQSSASKNLGSASLSWKDIYFFGDAYLAGNRFLGVRGTNTFFGSSAGNPLVTGTNNTATGTSALALNINGNWNTANGYHALVNSNNAFSNTATGFQTLISNTDGSYNTATGVLALSNNTTGTHNSAHGVSALNLVAAGTDNSALGFSAGGSLNGGNNNTFLGAFADVPTGISLSNSTAVGYGATATASNTVKAGNTSVTSIGGYVGWTTYPSDGRFKRNVKANVPGLAFINQLRPVTYNVDVEAIEKILHPSSSVKRSLAGGELYHPSAEELQARKEKAAIVYSGFIAQEVESVARQLGFQFSGVDVPKNKTDLYGLRYAEFVVPLVKAVQELNGKLDLVEKENQSLRNSQIQDKATKDNQQQQINRQQEEINSLKSMMAEMKKEINALKTQNAN